MPSIIDQFLLTLIRASGDAVTPADLQAHTDHILKELRTMSDKLTTGLDALKADIAAQTTVIASATTFISGLSAQLTSALNAASAAGATADQLQELTDLDAAVKANTGSLSSAVSANTPAANDAPTAPADPLPVDPAAPAVTDTTVPVVDPTAG